MNWRWRDMLVGPLLWAAHFFILYGIGEFGDGGRLSRAVILMLTLILLVGLIMAWRRIKPHPAEDEIDRWQLYLTKMLLMLSGLAVIWQTMPALLSY